MKHREALLLCLGLALLALLFFSILPSRPQQAGDPALVGFINLRDGRVFSGTIQKDFQALAAADPALQMEYYSGEDSPAVQRQLIHELVQRKAKAIILMATNSVDLIPGVQEANDAGIPVITLNARVYGGNSVYVGPLEYDAGWLQGEYLRDRLPQGAKIVYFKGNADWDNTQQRLRGFVDACIMERPDIQLVRCDSAEFSEAKARRMMSQWLQQEPQIDGVVAANDEMAEGALAALESAGREQGVLIAGIDARKSARQWIREGSMTMSVRQDARAQAQGAYDALKQLLAGKIVKDVLLPFKVVDRQNVDGNPE